MQFVKVNSKMANSDYPVDHEVYLFSVTDRCKEQGMNRASLGGVFSSLAKKRLAKSYAVDGDDDTCLITLEGWNVVNSVNKGEN
jgi:hypothetical protein